VDAQWHVVFRFVLAALAVWRVSFLMAREEGPWGLLERMRRGAGRGVLGKLLGCVKCLSVWVAVPFTFFVGGDGWQKVVVWLALSGVASLVDEWTRPPFEWRETPTDELLRGDRDSAAQ
jgi:hypothetical protein